MSATAKQIECPTCKGYGSIIAKVENNCLHGTCPICKGLGVITLEAN
jgi:DnaJ-class molecular chaperone